MAASTPAKAVVAGAAPAAAAYARVLGKRIEPASSGPQDAQKAAARPLDTDKAQRHLPCPHDGTVFAPGPLPGAVHDGWRRHDQRLVGRAPTVVSAGLVALAAGALGRRR
ncbi:hypothetical protein [Streptomyces roseolus]|uniref:hypothetical protein n=1 Tax=Streptomyces roseolus TaxID=67358 RepID=UPI0016769B0E|nr:hypothetical protein [Streptomyces roseolus]GGR63075.1 hypothetical protein GCM10010282_65130 [Streptomyces roseolus]